MITLKSNKKDLQKYIDYVEAYSADYETPDSLFHQQPSLLTFKEFLISKLPQEEQNQNFSIEFREENFENITFIGKYEDCVFINCRFEHVDFSKAILNDCNWTANYFSQSTLTPKQTNDSHFYLNDFYSDNYLISTSFLFGFTRENLRSEHFNQDKSMANLYIDKNLIDIISQECFSSTENADTFYGNYGEYLSYFNPLKAVNLPFLILNDFLQENHKSITKISYNSTAITTFVSLNIAAKTVSFLLPPEKILDLLIPPIVIQIASASYIISSIYLSHNLGTKAFSMSKSFLHKLEIYTNSEHKEIKDIKNYTSILDRFSNFSRLEEQKFLEVLEKSNIKFKLIDPYKTYEIDKRIATEWEEISEKIFDLEYEIISEDVGFEQTELGANDCNLYIE